MDNYKKILCYILPYTIPDYDKLPDKVLLNHFDHRKNVIVINRNNISDTDLINNIIHKSPSKLFVKENGNLLKYDFNKGTFFEIDYKVENLFKNLFAVQIDQEEKSILLNNLLDEINLIDFSDLEYILEGHISGDYFEDRIIFVGDFGDYVGEYQLKDNIYDYDLLILAHFFTKDNFLFFTYKFKVLLIIFFVIIAFKKKNSFYDFIIVLFIITSLISLFIWYQLIVNPFIFLIYLYITIFKNKLINKLHTVRNVMR